MREVVFDCMSSHLNELWISRRALYPVMLLLVGANAFKVSTQVGGSSDRPKVSSPCTNIKLSYLASVN